MKVVATKFCKYKPFCDKILFPCLLLLFCRVSWMTSKTLFKDYLHHHQGKHVKFPVALVCLVSHCFRLIEFHSV